MQKYDVHGDGLIRSPRNRSLRLRPREVAIVLVAAAAIYTARQGGGFGVDPGELMFPAQAVGSAANARPIVVRNWSSRPVAIAQINITGEHAGDFRAAGGCLSRTLEPGGACTVTVQFAPIATGNRGAHLIIASGGSRRSDVPLGGLAWQPGVSVQPAALRFQAEMGTAAVRPQTVVVTNIGGGPLEVTSVRVAAAPEFSPDASACLHRTLPPGGKCGVQVTFRPRRPGTFNASLAIGTSAQPVSVPLAAEVTATAAAAIAVDPGSIVFGSLRPGEREQRSFVVSNIGEGRLQVRAVRSDAVAAFAVAPTGCLNTSLLPGGTCSVQISFAPLQPGHWSTTVTVDSSAGQRTVMITGDARAAAVPQFALDPRSVEFGNVPVANRERRAVNVSSTGTAPLEIRSAVAAPDVFTADASECEKLLAPGRGCRLWVQFRALQAGGQFGSLTVETNAGQQRAALNANSIDVIKPPPRPGVQLSPPTVDFGGSPSRSKRRAEVMVRSTGTGPLRIDSAIASPAGIFQADRRSCVGRSLPPGESCRVPVEFTPKGLGVSNGALAFETNAGHHTVPLQGDVTPAPEGKKSRFGDFVKGVVEGVMKSQPGQQAAISVEPPVVRFRTVAPGQVDRQIVTLRSTGNAAVEIRSAAAAPPFGLADAAQCIGRLDPGRSCQMLVVFNPGSPGPQRGYLMIASTAGEGRAELYGESSRDQNVISGTYTGLAFVARLVVDPTTVVFNLGAPPIREVALSNGGNVPLTIQAANLTSRTGFAIDTSQCLNRTLQPREQCRVRVSFAPPPSSSTREGPVQFKSALQIISTAGNQSVSLTGTTIIIR